MGSLRGTAGLDATSPTATELADIARREGIAIAATPMPEGLLGLWDHVRRRIILDHRLTPVEHRCVLAHELGHALLGHRGHSDAGERAAERFAARVLIDPAALEAAMAWARTDDELAEALDVTEDVLLAYAAHAGPRRA